MDEDEQQHDGLVDGEGATPSGKSSSKPSGEAPETPAPDAPADDPSASSGGTPIPPSIGNVVYVPYMRAWRERAGLTRAVLSERTAGSGPKPISLFTFRQIEAYGKPARYRTVQRIADALELSVDELLHTDPSKLPPRRP